MGGTSEGGKQAAETNKKRHGEDFFKQIGSLGGKNGRTGGFAHMKATGQLEKLREAGRKGGLKSRKNGVKDNS